jgi:hypothetical protein
MQGYQKRDWLARHSVSRWISRIPPYEWLHLGTYRTLVLAMP